MTELELAEAARRIKRVRKQFDDFTIAGDAGVQVAGSMREGFAVNVIRKVAEPGVTGACCIGETCSVVTSDDCASGGGTYIGDATVCDPNPCLPPPIGACCFDDGTCDIETVLECAFNSGTYQGDFTDCDPNPCPQPGACCFDDGSCDIETEAECASNSGTYQGDSTTCDPNPCPQPGACCYSDNSCFILSETDCDNSGGDFQGGSTVCDPNPCFCPTVSLVCDSVSGSKSKCGFAEFTDVSTPPKLYLTKTTTFDWTLNSSSYPALFPDGCFLNVSQDYTIIESYDHVTCVQSGPTCTYCVGSNPDEDPSGCSTSHNCFVTNTGSACVWNSGTCPDYFVNCETNASTSTTTTQTEISTVTTYSDLGPKPENDCSGGKVHDVRLSDEYTTDMLKSDVIDALPSFPGTFTGTCSASAELTTDEHTYTISQFIPKFVLGAPATRNFTINYNEHFVPDSGSPSNTPQTVSGVIGDTFVIGPEVDQPDSNGTITITDIVVTCP